MSLFKKFDPWAESEMAARQSDAASEGAAKAAKPAKAEEIRHAGPAKAVLKFAKLGSGPDAGGCEAGRFSRTLAGGVLKFADQEARETAASSRATPDFSRFSSFSRDGRTENDGADIPRAWAEGVARLRTMPVPPAFRGKDWPKPLLDDAERFLADWGAIAARLGWPDWALWGVQRRVPSSWRGRELVALLGGCPVVALTATEAVIQIRPRVNHTYRRPARDPLHPAERALLWELAGGPLMNQRAGAPNGSESAARPAEPAQQSHSKRGDAGGR